MADASTPANTGTPATSVAGQQTGTEPPVNTPAEETTQTTETPPQTVDVPALLKRLDGQSATISRLQKTVEKLEKSREAEQQRERERKPTEPPAIAEQMRELQEQQKVLLERDRRQRERQAKQEIVAALTEAGVHADDASDQADLLMLRNGSRIEVDEDFRAHIEDSGDKIPLRDWVKTFLSTDRGRRLLPAKKNPSTAGVPSTTNELPDGRRKVTRADMAAGKVMPEEIRKGKVVIVD
jgi:hypothetical protein